MGETDKIPEAGPPAAETAELSILIQQYQTVVALVMKNQSRLDFVKLAFLSANFVMLVSLIIILKSWGIDASDWAFVDLKATFFFLPITGMTASVVWLAISMRIQLMQRLHYFQLRELENKLGLDENSGIFNQTGVYWSGKNLISHDGKYTLTYPKGADGRMGAITFRVWAWLMPLWFFFAFFYSFLALLLSYS